MENSKQTQLQENLIYGILTVSLCALGYWMLELDYIGWGYTLFISTPICVGFALGKRASWRHGVLYTAVIALLCFLGLLVSTGREGLLCVVLLSPLIALGMILGVWIGQWLRGIIFRDKDSSLHSIVIPILVILLSGAIEHQVEVDNAVVNVSSTIFLPYPPEAVFTSLEAIDTLDTKKPFLFNFGLPVPEKCVLDSGSVGSFRTCYFKDGYIKQEITEYEPGISLEVKIVESTLMGMPWITFQNARYEFIAVEGGTQLTRRTSYSSSLKPGVYWRWAENLGVEAEHEYVFRDLEKRLLRQTGK